MIQTFKFNKAEISFENDKIIISDDAKQQLLKNTVYLSHLGLLWYFVYPEIYEHRRPVFALVRPDYWIGAFGNFYHDPI